MLFFHLFRSLGYLLYGVCQRWRALRANPQNIITPLDKHYTYVYAGLRMVDILGHVNNSKYLEICELARWHFGGYSGLFPVLLKARVNFVAASVVMQFVREMPPFRRYLVTTEVLRFEGANDSGTNTSSNIINTTPSAETSKGSDGNDTPRDGRVVLVQEIWSADGKKLYAGVLFRAALVGDANSPIALPSTGERRGRSAPLCCSSAFAVNGTTTTEVKAMAAKNTERFYARMGFNASKDIAEGKDWIDGTRQIERAWRSGLRNVKSPQ
ncbi:uncharacterized protein TM35_000242020 [Trypanosoma theileri]|uniref:Thioesterase n=1 Tax=Trypanosoma theileri TaxID=67003 RepID=A0A1X0NQR4_9TRYP|nr:uncharacterized protein TM35_000242020 [Trypanosoma theileri]ORC87052.1 hypothetical protein TM35_000242020 [Trypanosoma theileri]